MRLTSHRLTIVDKPDLTPAQAAAIEARLSLPIHQDDEGPSRAWRTYDPTTLYAYFEQSSGALVALVDAGGQDDVKPGWWVDSAFRGRGFGAEVVDLLAAKLKARGVTRIGWILIATHNQEYDAQSGKLVRRLRRHFEET
jgi:RimJ/RimL family protein N-acetyltransferase